jgi:hypothetical protein
MAQLYAKLLLNFWFLWESVVQAFYLLVCTAAFSPSLTDKVAYPCVFFFVLSTPPNPNTTFAYSSSHLCVTCRWAFETPHKAKRSRAPLSTLVSFGSIPAAAAAAGDSFSLSLVFDKVLHSKFFLLFSPC